MENTIAQVVLVRDVNPGVSDYGDANSSFAYGFTEFNEQLFFTADDGENGDEFWVSNGTTEGTQLLADINPGISDYGYSNGSFAYGFTEFNEQLFFTADDGENGNELWVSDGTTEGTQLLLDINPGISDYGYANNSNIFGFTEFNDQLFFAANDGENGNELWVSDGTTEGTQLLIDINPGVNNYGNANSSYADGFTEFNDQLFFAANDGENGNELWVSDGTTEGTQLLLDINPGVDNYGNANSSYADGFTEFNDQLFFAANDGENGNELWVSDGTTEGTQLLLDINPGVDNYGYANSSSLYNGFTEFNDQLFFAANDGENGNELWVSDGTTEGTQLLLDINPGVDNYGYTNSSYVYGFTEFNDQLFFTANNVENGNELWVSDGTTEGTQLLVDINPGTGSYSNGSYTSNLIVFDDQLFFTADDGENGNELWVSDGTTEGTQLLVDINPGTSNYGYSNGSYASDLIVFDDQLFFAANDGENGNELFKLSFDDLGTNIVGTDRADNLTGSDAVEEIDGLGGNDNINGLGGNDSLIGGNGSDNLFGEDGNDVLTGGNGNDSLSGDNGDDQLLGLGGDDFLMGGDGNDLLTGGQGQNRIEGGSGSDTFIFSDEGGNDNIIDFETGIDIVALPGGISFDDLTTSGNRILFENRVLGSFEGLEVSTLTADDFTSL